MKQVWHYFNEVEDFCWTTNSVGLREKPLFVLCGLKAEEVELHTEHRSQVTCKKCLHRIIQLDEAEGSKKFCPW